MRCALVVLLIACGPRSPSPPATPPPRDAAIDAPLDQDLGQLALRSVKLYESIVATFTAAGEDCPLAITKLDALATEHADVIAANAKVALEDRGAALQVALKPYDDQLSAAAKAIMQAPTMAKCAPDPAFQLAWGKLVGPPS